jgi:hypothetical protein
MTTSYLTKFGQCVLDAGGHGRITLAPDVGQYWLPTTVHVGTTLGTGFTQASLHAGAITVVDSTTRKDYTFEGNSDTSTILSGTVVEFGQAVTVDFNTGVPGDIGIMEIIGVSSDTPPTIGISPGIPGARFSGAGNFIVDGFPRVLPNKAPKGYFVGPLATNATGNVLPAVAGLSYFLFTMVVIAPGANGTFSIQDTAGNDLGIYTQPTFGAPAAGVVAPLPQFDFKGAPLTTGLGLQIKNLAGVALAYEGHVTYGQSR